MKIIEQSHEIIHLPENSLQMIEAAGRTCYKSENKITDTSAENFVKMLRDRGHEAMLEFGDITVKFITNRGVTHELVRHRLFSFAQESTRYVKYGGDTEFIRPVWCSEKMLGLWNFDNPLLETKSLPYNELTESEWIFFDFCHEAEVSYKYLLDEGWRPEQAREVLPNSLKTEIVVKGNIREWRHTFKLRTSKKAHPQMRALMLPLLEELQQKIPVVFDDVYAG